MLTTYLVLLAALVAASCALTAYGNSGYGGWANLAGFLGFLGAIASAAAALAGLLLAYNWFAASYQAQIINREYSTQYTQAEVFYASSVIDTIRQLDRKRVEVNGDLLRD